MSRPFGGVVPLRVVLRMYGLCPRKLMLGFGLSSACFQEYTYAGSEAPGRVGLYDGNRFCVGEPGLCSDGRDLEALLD